MILTAPAARDEFYIGLMSGTSLDGIDGVLCRLHADGRWGGVLAHEHAAFDAPLRDALMALQHSGPNELHHAALAGNALARACAQVCAALRERAGGVAIRAIGSHGQTVRHQPGLHDGTGYTIQLDQPALLAELTGLDVIADFRSRDVAAGGQGAPLVPPFHAAVFGSGVPSGQRAIVNIGGISNLTLLPADGQVRGFDCGPGNALLDHWCQRHLGRDFDASGHWAAGGHVDAALLQRLLAEPYLSAPPPKSTGRDLFNPTWLAPHLNGCNTSAQDVQATLSELTACAIAQDLARHAPQARELIICGGGALNLDLMQRLARLCAEVPIRSSDELGLPVLQVEAAAFAWLARMHCHRLPASAALVTGARGTRVLGACYPA